MVDVAKFTRAVRLHGEFCEVRARFGYVTEDTFPAMRAIREAEEELDSIKRKSDGERTMGDMLSSAMTDLQRAAYGK